MWNKIKDVFSKYKEMRKDPGKRALIKLSLYVIFFIIFFSIASVGVNTNSSSKSTTSTTTTTVESLKNKMDRFLNSEHTVTFNTKIDNISYSFDGNYKDNILNGYLTIDDVIKKVTIKDDLIYEVKKDELVLMDSFINMKLFDIKYIFSVLEKSSSLILNGDGDNIRKYTIIVDEDSIDVSIYSFNEIGKIEYTYNDNSIIIDFDL